MDLNSLFGRESETVRPCFIIAEAGVNHNGDLEMAKRLIDAAIETGADAVKFQTWITEKLVSPDAPLAEYQAVNLAVDPISQYEMLKALELPQSAFSALKDYADQKGIMMLSTPDEEESADFLDRLGLPILKVGSGEVTNLGFLRHIALKRKPIILSTGMSGLGDVEAAVNEIEAAGNDRLILLHCVSSYPAMPEDCNLTAISTLRSAFQYPVGFSDHTTGWEVAVAAVALGARVIEKHLTLDNGLPGPDHAASLDPGEFTRMVHAIRTAERALGSGRKWPTSDEMETKSVVQKSIVSARPIKAGHRLEAADLALRRSSGGLAPAQWNEIVGKAAKDAIEANCVIKRELLE